MRVPAIARHHIEDGHGPYEDNELFARHFSFVDAGKDDYLLSIVTLQFRVRYSILPAISLDGIISVDIIEGSFTTAKFARFIDGLLDQMNPFPGPNSVIIMDNCRIHKSDVILDMITERSGLFRNYWLFSQY